MIFLILIKKGWIDTVNKKNVVLGLFVVIISLMMYFGFATILDPGSLDMSNTSLTSRSIRSGQNLSGTLSGTNNVSVVIIANGTYANNVTNITFQWRNGLNRVIFNMTIINAVSPYNQTYFANITFDTTQLADGINYNVTALAFNKTYNYSDTAGTTAYGNGSILSWGIANITIDNTVPSVTSLNPSNGTEYLFVFNTAFATTTAGLGSNQSFNASVTDATSGVANITVFFSNSSASAFGAAGTAFNRTTSTTNVSGIWAIYENVSRIKAGTTTVRFFTRDFANNEDRGQVLTISVNTPHNVTPITVGDQGRAGTCVGQNFSARNTTQFFNTSVINASIPPSSGAGPIPISRVIFRFDNGSSPDFNQTGTLNLTSSTGLFYWATEFNVSTLAEGSNRVTIYVNDTWGNINNTETCSFTIDKSNPSATVDCGSGYDNPNDVVTCTCSGSDGSGTGVRSNVFPNELATITYLAGTGGTSDTCTVTDKVGNTATATGTWTVSSGSTTSGGGGGGGSSGGGSSCVALTHAKKHAWTEINPEDKPEFVTNDDDFGITKVKFHVNKKGKGHWMEIRKGDCGCGNFSRMPTKTYKCMEIIKAKIVPEEEIASPTLEFKVANSWFVSNGIARNGVALFRYTTTWEELPTTLGIDNGTFTTYTAETPGFSYFAIGAKTEAPAPVVAPEPEPVVAPPTPTPTPTGQAIPTAPVKQKALWPWVVLLGIIIVVIVIISSMHKKTGKK